MKARDAALLASRPVTSRLTFSAVVLLGALIGALPLSARSQSSTLAAGKVFELREASAFEEGSDEFVHGQSADTKDAPYTEVKRYPQFVSGKPIYGVIRLGVDYRRPDSGKPYYFAIDESKGTGRGYDRLMFDLNHDLDLCNEEPLKPLPKPPSSATVNYSGVKEQVLFANLSVPFDLAQGGQRNVEIMPRLLRSTYEDKTYDQVSFVRTRLYAGSIKLGKAEYGVRLGNKYVLTGGLDEPGTALVLTPRDGGRIYWWGSDSLKAIHKLEGTFYTFSATPAGDKLTVRPYSGELGIFKVGPGKRSVEKLSFSGSLYSTNASVPLGGEVARGSVESARTCEVPVGDYLPNSLHVEFGRLQIFLSDNYHSDGKPRQRDGREPVYGVHIRKDRPFVLDFANQPEVLFASPAKGERVKPGDTLEVKAVLVDPVLNIMVRGLTDTTRKQKTTGDGRPLNYERNLSLDPKVAVKRKNGETVAEGVMPFG